MTPAMWVPVRRHDPEIMDRPDNPRADLEAALADIARVNRWLGGCRALVRGLARWLVPGGRLELLDVGTGGADLPLEVARAARRRGCAVRITAVDRDPHTAAIARRATAADPDIAVVRADAFCLPFPPGTFDIVTASMFLHHFEHGDAVRLLAELRRVARRAVLINDLRRHRLPWATIALLAHATGRHAMFVHDAPLSVLRGFTPAELLRAARESGAPRASVRRSWPYRLLLTVETEAPA